jgi:hypothetical protein
VTIYVGKDKAEFAIHEKLLCDRVEYFKKAFRGGFKEAAEGVMHLLEEDPDVFEIFVEWLYQECLPSFHTLEDPKLYYRLYMFAEKTVQEELANATADTLRVSEFNDGSTAKPVLDIIEEVYEKTIDGSPLRELCAASLAYQLHNDVGFHWGESLLALRTDSAALDRIWQLCSKSKDIFRDFLDCMVEYMGGSARQPPSGWGVCRFHQHTTTDNCA